MTITNNYQTVRNPQSSNLTIPTANSSNTIHMDENPMYVSSTSPSNTIHMDENPMYVSSTSPSNTIHMDENPMYIRTHQRQPSYVHINSVVSGLFFPLISSSTIRMDENPTYVSSNSLRIKDSSEPIYTDINELRTVNDTPEPIYEEIPPALPPRNFTNPNPCYISNETPSTPPSLPVRTASFHARFRQRFSFWPSRDLGK